jgi:hypothetical protein
MFAIAVVSLCGAIIGTILVTQYVRMVVPILRFETNLRNGKMMMTPRNARLIRTHVHHPFLLVGMGIAFFASTCGAWFLAYALFSTIFGW